MPGYAFDYVGNNCCIGTDYGNCQEFECSYGGKTRYFTNCGKCSDSNRTLSSLGDNQPCGAGSYGKRGLCTLCPEPGTSEAASTVITDCYVPAGTGGTDTTGKWEYTADCHYSN